MVSVRKRGKVYEYRFETASVDGTSDLKQLQLMAQGNGLLNLDFQQDKMH